MYNNQVAARLIKHGIGRQNQISISQSQRKEKMLAAESGTDVKANASKKIIFTRDAWDE